NWRVLPQIAATEDYQAANLAIHSLQTFAVKILFSPLWTDAPHGFHRIFAAAGGIQRLLINVGGVNFDVVILNAAPKMLGQQNCDGICLFAAGASRAPGAKRVTG